MKDFKLQRGFVLGVTVVAIMAVVTGAFIKLQSINADTTSLSQFGDYAKSIARYNKGTTCDKIESTDPATLTDAEKEVVGTNGQVYIIHNTPQNKDFRVAVGTSEVSKSGSGGVVKFTVYYTPVRIGNNTSTSTVYTEKKGRWLLVFNDDKYLDFYYDNPKLKIGSYQTLTKTVAIPDYTWAQKVNLELRNGSYVHFQGCIARIIDLKTMLTPSPTPSPSVSASASASASASTSVTSTASASQTATVSMRNGLRGDYYNGLEFKTGILTRIDPNLNFDWGNASPNTSITKNNFSVRWTGFIKPKYSELYTLRFDHNDGIRVWVNDNLVLDNWKSINASAASKCALLSSDEQSKGGCNPIATPTVTSTRTTIQDSIYRDTVQLNLTANTLYSIKVEYYDQFKQAIAKMFWKSASQQEQVIPKENLFTAYDPNPAAGTGNGLKAEYFSDKLLTKLFKIRTDKNIEFAWGTGAAIQGMPKDGFSVRWTGEIEPRFSDLYTFLVNAKDGVRLKVNDQLVINQWKDQTKLVQYSGKINLQGGVKYKISLEYYNNQGKAEAKLLWKSMSQEKQVIPMKQLYSTPIDATATSTVSVSPSATASATLTAGPNSMTIKHGFNAIYIPEGMGIASTDTFTQKGMTMFAFNRNGNKKWSTSVRIMNHWVGYYVFNPLGTTTVELDLVKMPETAADKYIVKGWNLLSNSAKKDLNVKDMKYYVSSGCELKAGEVNCQNVGTESKLGDLLTSKRAYGYIYIIKDPYAAEADQAFELIKVTSSNVDSVKIPAGKLFWFYLYN